MDPSSFIDAMGSFGSALHVAAPAGVRRNPFRGVPLVERDRSFTTHLAGCTDLALSTDLSHADVAELWEALRDTPEWGGPPLWLHGDLHPLNLLVRTGQLTAVIDWGDVTAGDPAVDLAIAWMVLDSADRDAFRHANLINGRPVDIHTWNRARGSALAFGVGILAHSSDTPSLNRLARRTIAAVTE